MYRPLVLMVAPVSGNLVVPTGFADFDIFEEERDIHRHKTSAFMTRVENKLDILQECTNTTKMDQLASPEGSPKVPLRQKNNHVSEEKIAELKVALESLGINSTRQKNSPLPPIPNDCRSRCLSRLPELEVNNRDEVQDLQADIQGFEADSRSHTLKLKKSPRFFKRRSRSSDGLDTIVYPMTRREAEILLISYGRETDGAFLFRKSGPQYILSMCANTNLHHFKLDINLEKYTKGKLHVTDLDEAAEIELREIAKHYSRKTRGMLPAPLLHEVKYELHPQGEKFVVTNTPEGVLRGGRKMSLVPTGFNTRSNSERGSRDRDSIHEYYSTAAGGENVEFRRRSKSESQTMSSSNRNSVESHIYMDTGVDPLRKPPPLFRGFNDDGAAHAASNENSNNNMDIADESTPQALSRGDNTPIATTQPSTPANTLSGIYKDHSATPASMFSAVAESLAALPKAQIRRNESFRRSLWDHDDLDEDFLPTDAKTNMTPTTTDYHDDDLSTTEGDEVSSTMSDSVDDEGLSSPELDAQAKQRRIRQRKSRIGGRLSITEELLESCDQQPEMEVFQEQGQFADSS